MGTTNTQLREMIDNFGITGFRGCYYKDMLTSLEPNSSYIINLEDKLDSDGNINNGTHWTCLVTNFRNQAIYFDPFGFKMPKCVESLLKNYKYEYAHTTKQVQNKITDLCGYWCVSFIYFIKRHPKRTKNIYKDANIFLGLFENLKLVKSLKNEYILSMFFIKKNKEILENNNNVFSKVLPKTFKIENVSLYT